MKEPNDLQYLSHRISIACVCGRSGGITIRRVDRYGLDFDFKLCTLCGHVRTSNPLDGEASRRFYSSSDYRSMYFPGESAQEVLLRKTPKPKSLTPLLKYAQKFTSQAGTIVEWGCGGGWNLVPFRDAGWKVAGFDHDEPYVNLGRRLLGLDLRQIQDRDVNADDVRGPDVILLNHVLEHVTNPVDLLRRLRNLGDSRTTFLVGVPLLETMGNWHWRDFFHVAHVHYFSSRTFTYVIQQAGFRVVHEDIEEGLFALRLADDSFAFPRIPHRTSVLRSAGLLAGGFIDPKFRLRLAIRKLLSAVGLLNVARKARSRIHG